MIEFDDIVKSENLKALGIVGSRAVGDSNEFSDYDLIGISDKNTFKRIKKNNWIIELHITSSVLEWQKKPSWWYALEHIKVIIDDGTIGNLPELIKIWEKSYSPSKAIIQNNYVWLDSVEQKIKCAKTKTKLSYLLSTSLWEILSGVFIAKGKPIPANSDMFRLMPSIIGEELFEKLVDGTLEERKESSLTLIKEVKASHDTTIDREN